VERVGGADVGGGRGSVEDGLEAGHNGFGKRDELDETRPAIALELSPQGREDFWRVRAFPPLPKERGRELGTAVPGNGQSIRLRQQGFDRLVSWFQGSDSEEISGIKVKHPHANFGLRR
jgi:hypothetical protein